MSPLPSGNHRMRICMKLLKKRAILFHINSTKASSGNPHDIPPRYLIRPLRLISSTSVAKGATRGHFKKTLGAIIYTAILHYFVLREVIQLTHFSAVFTFGYLSISRLNPNTSHRKQ